LFSGISKKVIFFSFLFINFLQPSKSAEFTKINKNINNQNNTKNFLELKNKLKPLCKNFVDFGNYFSENIALD